MNPLIEGVFITFEVDKFTSYKYVILLFWNENYVAFQWNRNVAIRRRDKTTLMWNTELRNAR